MFLFPFAAPAQKAYEVVKYSGKSGSLAVAFDFADGYPEASELTLSEAGKSVNLSVSGDAMNFEGTLAGKPVAVQLEMDPYGEAPKTVDATVSSGDTKTKLKLIRK